MLSAAFFLFDESNRNMAAIQQCGNWHVLSDQAIELVTRPGPLASNHVREGGSYVAIYSPPFTTDLTKNSPQGYSSPKPEASAILPPEILDKILEYVPADWKCRRILIACALVATWWTGPSQRRLFASISINDKNYQRWMNGVVLSASKTRLLRYVRSFTHSGCKPVRNLLKDCGEFLPALRNIHRLVLLKINIEHLGDEELHAYFSAFRETLTTLVLQFSTTSFSTFVALVNYFPNITSLRVGRLALKLDEGPVPTLSKSFGGKIWVHCSVPSGCELLDRLAMLDLEYDELIVETSNDVTTDVLESVLRVSAGTVRYLRLTAPLGGKHPCCTSPPPHFLTCIPDGTAASIGHFRQLQELEFPENSSITLHQRFLTSINSTELRKVIFPVRSKYYADVFLEGAKLWASTDKQLCELVTRLGRAGYRHTLEVEFRLYCLGEGKWSTLLPEFRDRLRGVVTVVKAACRDQRQQCWVDW